MHPLAVIFKVLKDLTFPVPLDVDAKNFHVSILVLEDDRFCKDKEKGGKS